MWLTGSAAPMKSFSPRSFEEVHLRDGGHVHKGMDGGMPALFQVEQQIRSARDGQDGTGRLRKGL